MNMVKVIWMDFERHHETHAQLWERQALLRARPVGGSAVLGARFEVLPAIEDEADTLT